MTTRGSASARYLMVRETSQRVCEGLALALRTYGVPGQILTDNGKVFTGRFNRPPVEVLFDRVCRENGIEHLLTQPRSPTTTGKIERFHRALRTEFRTDRVFADLRAAQAELDEWVGRVQHQPTPPGPGHGHPGQRFRRPDPADRSTPLAGRRVPAVTRRGPHRRHLGGPPSQRGRGGVRQLAAGLPRRGRRRPTIDVWVTDQVLQFYDGDQLLRTEDRTSTGEVRRKRAQVPGGNDVLECNECHGSTEVDLSPINRRSSAAPLHFLCNFACVGCLLCERGDCVGQVVHGLRPDWTR